MEVRARSKRPPRPPWSGKETADLCDLRQQGKEWLEISIQIGRSERACHEQFHRINPGLRHSKWSLEAKANLKQLYDTTQDLSYISEKIGRTEGACRRKLYRLYPGFDGWKWSREEKANLIQLYDTTKDLSYISEKIGRTKGACQRKLQEVKTALQPRGSPDEKAELKEPYNTGKDFTRTQFHENKPMPPASMPPIPPTYMPPASSRSQSQRAHSMPLSQFNNLSTPPESNLYHLPHGNAGLLRPGEVLSQSPRISHGSAVSGDDPLRLPSFASLLSSLSNA